VLGVGLRGLLGLLFLPSRRGFSGKPLVHLEAIAP